MVRSVRKRGGFMSGVKWSYGVMTVPSRCHDLLPQTLRSLREGGFTEPHLFVDGWEDVRALRLGLDHTVRVPSVGVAGNWVLSVYELYYREPTADYFVLFQDDILCCRNLRDYLEDCGKPKCEHYLSLYTSRSNEKIVPRASGAVVQDGWYQSNQLGRGALGLMFTRDVLVKLLSSPHMARRPQCPTRGMVGIDGGVVTALLEAGVKEYVHWPSLLQHTGEVSTLGHDHPRSSESFRGESYDPLELLVRKGQGV